VRRRAWTACPLLACAVQRRRFPVGVSPPATRPRPWANQDVPPPRHGERRDARSAHHRPPTIASRCQARPSVRRSIHKRPSELTSTTAGSSKPGRDRRSQRRAQHSGAATNRFCRERNGPHHRPLDRDRPSRSNSSHFGHRHAVVRHPPKCYALPERCAFENGVTRIRRSGLLAPFACDPQQSPS
jgi:hypothetical protein